MKLFVWSSTPFRSSRTPGTDAHFAVPPGDLTVLLDAPNVAAAVCGERKPNQSRENGKATPTRQRRTVMIRDDIDVLAVEDLFRVAGFRIVVAGEGPVHDEGPRRPRLEVLRHDQGP